MSRLDAAYRVTERLWWDMTARVIVALIGALVVVRVVIAANAGMLWDEPYYWLWAQHLSPGYYDHPPMVALWIWLGTHIAGDNALGIRLLFTLNLAAVAAASYGIARVLFDRRTGEHAALWVAVSPVLLIAGMMATPDAPSILFWTVAMLAFALVVKTERGAWWIAFGVFAGLGLASKYTNFFLGLGVVLALSTDARLRRWFASPWFYAGGICAALIFSPVFAWNAGHDWESFRFQFGRMAETAFDPVDLLTLVVTQPLIFGPLVVVFLALAVRLWTRRTPPWNREIGILLATALPAVVFILFQATHGAVLQHWLAPVFPTLTVAAVAAASRLPDEQKYLRRMRTDLVPFALAAAVVVWAYILTPADRWFPGKDPLDSMRGWPGFATEVETLRQKAGATWIATVDYETTGTLAFYLRDAAPIIPITEQSRYTFLPAPAGTLLMQPALLLTKAGPAAFASCFAHVEKIGMAERHGARPIDAYIAYRAEGARPDLLTAACVPP